jgi:pimeloyl-ACP methyl ester carboxylesterase
MPGRWLSDSLPDPSLYGYPQYVSDIRTLIHHLGLTKVDYIGTSMGGIIGMLSFSIPLAEGAHAFEIGKFVLNDVGPYLPKAALLRISSYVGDHKFKSWEELMQYAKGIFKTFGCQNEQQWNQVVQYYVNPIDEGEYKFRLHYDPAIAQAFKSVAPEALTDVNMWPQWTNVKCDSALVLRGASSDLLLRETVEEMQRTAKFPLQFREIEGVGHAPTLLTDDQIQIVCDFLAV